MLQAQPRRVFFGAAVLTFVAGAVNAVGVAGVFHAAMSHVTGTVTRAALDVAAANAAGASAAAAIVVAFGAGAALSGALVGSRELKDARRCAAGLALEAALLAVAWQLLRRGLAAGEHVGALAAGLQNGLVTTWSGAILRTSHVTGVVTDIGVAVGLRLRGVPFDRRVALHTLMVAGFFSGGVAGGALWSRAGFDALVLPLALCAALAVLAARFGGPRAPA